MGKRGGAGAPGLGISGIDLTSAYPRGGWGKRFKFSTYLWSNQESIRTGPRQIHLGSLPPEMRGYPITKAGDEGTKKCVAQDGSSAGYQNYPNEKQVRQEIAGIYSSGRMNSKPKSRISPADSCRKTFATIGGVSLGTRLEEAGDGAGMVKWTVCSGRRICSEVMQAPVELILRVLVSSMNSAPETSVPLRKTGTCKRIRGERRVDEISEGCLFLRMSVSKWALNLSTKELVRMHASGMPEDIAGRFNKLFIIRRL